MARRHAGRAAAGAGIADEIRDIGPVPAFGDTDAAIRAVRNDLAGIVLNTAHKARAGPFPDVAADVEQAVLVGAEAAEGVRPGRKALFDVFSFGCVPLSAGPRSDSRS